MNKSTALFVAAALLLAASARAEVVVVVNPRNPIASLTSEQVAQIYLGEVTQWNDSRVRALNPNVNLPATQITPIYRSDASGTTRTYYVDELKLLAP